MENTVITSVKLKMPARPSLRFRGIFDLNASVSGKAVTVKLLSVLSSHSLQVQLGTN